MWATLNAIQPPKLQTYAALLYWLACRAGELLPYTHYKITYKKDENGKLLYDKNRKAIVVSRETNYTSPGIPVSTVTVQDNYIEFSEIPVFKSRNKDTVKAGIVPAKNNPLYSQITSYVLERKAVQQKFNEEASESGSPPVTVYLFEKELESESDLQFFWRFKKQLERFMNKKGFTVHSLRVTRATDVGNVSGDAFYVQSITGHASINMAGEYVKKKKLIDSMKRYGGI